MIKDAMHIRENGNESTLSKAHIARERSGMDTHEVLVADDFGIHAAFECVKLNLGTRQKNCISLVYSVNGPLSHILYKAELESLERRFISQLLTYYAFPGGPDRQTSCPVQQKLEIIINSNTCKALKFNVLGREDHVLKSIGCLLFLGIKPSQIQSQIFK